MEFKKPQDYVEALKELEGLPLMGMEVRLLDENGDVIAHVKLKNITRKEWLLGELYGKNLHDSMNVNQYKKYALLATGVVFTASSTGATGCMS